MWQKKEWEMRQDITKNQITQDIEAVPDKRKKFSSVLSTIGEGLAYLGTMVAAGIAMWSQVRASYSEKLKSHGYLKVARDAREEACSALNEKRVYDFGQGEVSVNTPELALAAEKDIDVKYKAAFNSVRQMFGDKHIWNQFSRLKKADKGKVLATGMTVISLGIGAIFAVRQNRRMERKLDELDEKINQARETIAQSQGASR